jgi:hypothetical protein
MASPFASRLRPKATSSRSIRGFQAPFGFFFRSAHHFRFASLRRLRVAALIRRPLRFQVV